MFKENADREISFMNTYVIFYPDKPSELFKEKIGHKSKGRIIYRTKVPLDTLKSSRSVIFGATATF